jgi:hypothetical protein
VGFVFYILFPAWCLGRQEAVKAGFGGNRPPYLWASGQHITLAQRGAVRSDESSSPRRDKRSTSGAVSRAEIWF